MRVSPVGAVDSKHKVFHTAAWLSEVDDALDAIGDVVKDICFHALETVSALDADDGVPCVWWRGRFFHVSCAFDVLRDMLTVCKGGAFHALPVGTVDNGRIALIVPGRLFPCLFSAADSPELCLIHCRMTNFPIRSGYAADPRRACLRPLML